VVLEDSDFVAAAGAAGFALSFDSEGFDSVPESELDEPLSVEALDVPRLSVL